jgi:WD40-like Beta Propeller Repeat
VARVVNVFISSPGDLFPERSALEEVLEETEQRAQYVNRVKLVPQMYENSAPPVVGMEPQLVVDRYLVPPDKVDLFVCMLWLRMGTPQSIIDPETKEGYRSGTEYEFLRAYRAFRRTGRPTVLLYHCLRPMPDELAYSIQPELVQQFFTRFDAETGALKGMVRTFTSADDLKAVFRKDLDQILARNKRLQSPRALDWLWRVPAPLLLALILLATLLVPAALYLQQPARIPSVSLAAANVGGWIFMREKIPGGPNVLETLDPRTATLRPLWPNSQELQHPTISAQFSDYYAPFYSAATHQVAFTAVSLNGSRSLWVAGVTFDKDGWPAIEGQPTYMVDLCSSCNEQVAWSPSGSRFIYAGEDGLYVLSPQTRVQQRITSFPQDGWPACSPNGQHLAYQGAHHGIEVIPTVDCVPVANADAHTEYINGFAFAWHPRWSLDGKQLIFTSDITSNWILYQVKSADLSGTYNPDQSTPFTRVGASDCGSETWARRLQPQQEVVVFSCKAANPGPGTYGCSLLIRPASSPDSWETTVSAGTHLWDDVEWVPSAHE